MPERSAVAVITRSWAWSPSALSVVAPTVLRDAVSPAARTP
ncbi:hypothetical protein STTU_2720 [Streptomyces sp. Tu6071]|nr:hypothetical protein STTU_2720 [Streptomyces sp. Tu6071]